MKTIEIKLTYKETGSSQEISAEFEDSEIDLLTDYLSNTRRLNEAKVVQSGMPGNLQLHYDKKNGTKLSLQATLPDEENILSFLHRMRRFILNDECSSYNRVTGIIARRFNDSSIRSMIKTQRKIYDGKDFQQLIQIESNGVLLNSEKMLFDWLNAFEYHSDQTKKEEIKLLIIGETHG